MHCNIQGVKDKFNDLDLLTKELNQLKIICLNEHNISEINKTILNKLNHFHLADGFFRESSRGGSCILLHNSIQNYLVRQDLKCFNEELNFEGSFIEITSLKLVIVSIYRSPSVLPKCFLSKLKSLFQILNKQNKNKKVLIAADLNINILSDSKITEMFLNLNSTYGFEVNIRKPTRITELTETCIDNILTSANYGITSVFNIDKGLSDHNALFVELPVNVASVEKTTVQRRLFSVNKCPMFLNSLSNSISNLNFDKSVNENFKEFLSCYKLCMEEVFPLRVVKTKNYNKDKKWITKGIIKSSENKRNLHCLAKTNKDPLFLNYVCKYKKIFKKVVSKAKQMSNNTYILNAKNKSKAMWEVVKDELGTKVKKMQIQKIVQGDNMHSKPEVIVELFNDQFSNVVERLNIPKTTSRGIAKNIYSLSDLEDDGHLDLLFFNFTNEQEVKKAILGLNNTTAKGWDDVPVKLLKWSVDIISNLLAKLINQSFYEGKFPDLLKLSEIKPIYKKGSETNLDNYRPISLLSNISKVYERIIYNQLYYFLEFNRKLCIEQFGFRKKLSTQSALYSFINKTLEALDQSQCTAGLFCDLSKAFDCVNHKILINKLQSLGIRGLALNYLKSYLENRKQRTILEQNLIKHYSKWSEIKYGVPQGSILGPLLFLAYINDLPRSLTNQSVQFTLYADDTTALIKSKNLNYLNICVSNTIQHINEWFLNQGLALNHDKTKVLQFNLRNTDNSQNISNSNVVKFLGVHLDSKLNWSEHIFFLNKKLSSVRYALSILTTVASFEVCLAVYYAHVFSILSYGIVLWGAAPHSIRAFITQKSIIRTLMRCNQRSSCRPFFKRLQLLTLPSIFILETLKMVHNNPTNFDKYTFCHNYNTRKCNKYKYPAHQLKKYESSPSYMGIKIYNKIPNSYRELSKSTFEKKIKEILCKKAYYSLKEFFDDSFE